MKYLVYAFCILSYTLSFAQTTNGLRGYYSFEGCPYNIDNTVRDESGNNSTGQAVGVPQCSCGVKGTAVSMDGIDDEVIFIGSVNNQFNKKDFSVSVYIKPLDYSSTQTILSKRENCSIDNAFSISFNPITNSVDVILSENSSKNANVSASLDIEKCWHHIVFVRSGNRSQLFINGMLRQEKVAVSRVDITNNVVFQLGESVCPASGERKFKGLIDELRIYEVALSRNDIASLYTAPDQIAVPDTTIFLGESVNIRLTGTCSDRFTWSPDDGVSDVSIAAPTIQPVQTTTYTLRFSDQESCIASDTIRITVIDPDDLDCKEVFLPNAFTPNNDNLNDFYGISNPYAIQNLISFEIFDRWGGRVFFTDDPFIRWDGSFKGKPMNPGILLYRVRFSCDGEEDIKVGSLSIIR